MRPIYRARPAQPQADASRNHWARAWRWVLTLGQLPKRAVDVVPYEQELDARSRHGGRAHLCSRDRSIVVATVGVRQNKQRNHRGSTAEQTKEPEPSILMIRIVM